MNGNVDLTTNEKELKIVFGDSDHICKNRDIDDARHSLKYILADLSDLKRSFVRLGFHLLEFRRYAYYIDFGYSTMEGFCEANLELSKSSLSRLIRVYLKFSKIQDFTHTMYLDEKYADYSYSQLCEMLNMSDEQCSQVKPDMTVKQIRELKKNVSRDVSQVATSQQEDKKDQKYYIDCGICVYDKSGEPFLNVDSCNVSEIIEDGQKKYEIFLKTDPDIE